MVLKTLVCAIQWSRLEERRGAASLQGHEHNQRIERLWRDVSVVLPTCTFTLFVVWNCQASWTLIIQCIFPPYIYFSTKDKPCSLQFTEAFNHQNVRREKKNWLPYQTWLNHMMQPENPLSNGKSYDFEYYGDDPDGPTPLDSDNNVVVEEIDLGQLDSVQSFVLERLDPLR